MKDKIILLLLTIALVFCSAMFSAALLIVFKITYIEFFGSCKEKCIIKLGLDYTVKDSKCEEFCK